MPIKKHKNQLNRAGFVFISHYGIQSQSITIKISNYYTFFVLCLTYEKAICILFSTPPFRCLWAKPKNLR
jgi:hypothetical protein